jgi:hypothetical protein
MHGPHISTHHQQSSVAHAPTNSALATLVEELIQRVAGLIRDFERDAAGVAAEEWRAGYMHGFKKPPTKFAANASRSPVLYRLIQTGRVM